MPKRAREIPLKIRTHWRLRFLYEMSKIISNFETVERTFPIIAKMAAETLPVLIAMLLEQRGKSRVISIWHVDPVNQEQVTLAQQYATLSYADLVGPLFRQVESQKELLNKHFIVLPMVTSRHKAFGVLLLQLEKKADEMDLTLIDTLANLIAIAIDQYYTLKEETELREKYINELELERGLRDTFVSVLTHDLRTPLTAARLSVELILKNLEKQELCSKLATNTTKSLDRLDFMIRDLLDANRIRAGEQLPLEIQAFGLRDLVESTLKELARVHGDRLVLMSAHEIQGYWSRDGIRRVMENLINNAVKYGAPQTPITITLVELNTRLGAIRPLEGAVKPGFINGPIPNVLKSPALRREIFNQKVDIPVQNVQIKVHNEGNPISPEDQTRLFQTYKRAASGDQIKIRGWGLGLTLVRGVVESHGGKVRLESSINQGTTFIIEIPIDARPFQAKLNLAS